MNVTEFTKYEKSGSMYKIVDATKTGYMRDDAKCILEAGKSVILDRFGDKEVVGFRADGKNKISLFVEV